ncbi:hypothetical protein L7F22_035035 [Adiantum nelumboides]|nr:hypothetical protein [Adiantum nelumboides]
MAASRDIKVFNVENYNETPLGAVCVKGESTYSIAQKEIIENELFEEPFHFVLEDFVAINAKQEEKCLVQNGPAYLKRKASDESLNINTSKVPCNDSRSSLRSDHEGTINDDMVSSQSAILEKDMLVSNENLHKWEKECTRECIWKELNKQNNVPMANFKDYKEVDDDNKIIASLKEGLKLAQDLCKSLNMEPTDLGHKTWWLSPWLKNDGSWVDLIGKQISEEGLHVINKDNDAQCNLTIERSYDEEEQDEEIAVSELRHEVDAILNDELE